jgi:hypothetical protein
VRFHASVPQIANDRLNQDISLQLKTSVIKLGATPMRRIRRTARDEIQIGCDQVQGFDGESVPPVCRARRQSTRGASATWPRGYSLVLGAVGKLNSIDSKVAPDQLEIGAWPEPGERRSA